MVTTVCTYVINLFAERLLCCGVVCTFVRLGPLVARAAMYTAGVVGGLSLTAACAPSEKYLNMSGPLTLGLGVVFVASLGKLLAFAQR